MSPPSEETVDEDVALVASLTGLRANHNLRERESERERAEEEASEAWQLLLVPSHLTPAVSLH